MSIELPKEQSENNFIYDEDYHAPMITSRGYVISKAISIENFIDKFITGYFLGASNKKEKFFIEYILNNTSLRLKIDIFKNVLSKLPLSNNERKSCKSFFKDIDFIIQKRNNLAHNEAVMIFDNDSVGYHNKKKSKLENIGTEELNNVYSRWLNIAEFYKILYKKYFFFM